jgi:proline racemase
MIPPPKEPGSCTDTPAGSVTVEAQVEKGKVTRVTFQNVPAFVAFTRGIEVPNRERRRSTPPTAA